MNVGYYDGNFNLLLLEKMYVEYKNFCDTQVKVQEKETRWR